MCSKHPHRTGAILLGVSSVGEIIFISAFALVDVFGATALWRTCAAGRHNLIAILVTGSNKGDRDINVIIRGVGKFRSELFMLHQTG